ncbi:MAG: WbqC family protein [Planctomycetes bacterium]|nr:WbqC family protein [Planctomycetota bacterium]
MIVCIHQPDFAPWLGFYERLVHADAWVVLDDVQFLRRGWHHRDRILGPEGPHWLTVPVLKRGRYEQEIREVMIDESEDWRRRHLATIANFYARAPRLDQGLALLEAAYAAGHHRLMDLNLEIILAFLERLEIRPEIVMASELRVASTRSQRLIDICRELGADRYLTGTGSRDYLDVAAFEAAGIEVVWQDYQPPCYDQGRAGFHPGLSALDALLHLGPAIKMLLEPAAAL